MQVKLYDCYFIASDKFNRKKVRYANNYAMRKSVLERDQFTIHDSKEFDSKLTVEQILDYLETNCDVNDIECVNEARARLNKSKTTVNDVLATILSRKDNTQSSDELVE